MASVLTKEQAENAVDLPAFLIVMSAYEYDDEYNRLQDGVDPEVVYFNETAAKKEAKRLSKEWALNQDKNFWEDGIPERMYYVVPIKTRNS